MLDTAKHMSPVMESYVGGGGGGGGLMSVYNTARMCIKSGSDGQVY